MPFSSTIPETTGMWIAVALLKRAKDVVDCNPDKDENDIGDPDLEMTCD